MSDVAHIIDMLARLQVITEEQAAAEWEMYERDWRQAFADYFWWDDLAGLAWSVEASWWEKLKNAWVPPVTWKYQWIEERRGW